MYKVCPIFKKEKPNVSLVPLEVLLNNRIEKDIERMLYPFNSLLLVLFSSKYTLQDNYITPNGKLRNTMSFLSVCFVIVTSIYFMYFDEVGNNYTNVHKNMIIWMITAFSFVYLSVGIVIFFILNIVSSQNNIMLIILIQIIHKSVDFSKNVRSFIVWNWFSVCVAVGVNVFIYSTHMVAFNVDYLHVAMFICDFIYAAFDVNCVYAIRVIMLLRKYLNEWTKKILTLYQEQGNEKYCIELFNIYQDILEAYKLFKKVFQVLILYTTVSVFIRHVGYLEIRLQMLKDLTSRHEQIFRSPLIGFVTILWMIKDLLLVIIHSLECEKFYKALRDAETTCIQLMKNRNCPNDQVRLCKQVIQINRSFSKMTACGLFYVDATLPIYLMGLLTSYVIILLQFAFLGN